MSNYIVFARKYRPQQMQDLVGQEGLSQTLTQAFEKNQIPHAILLHGIRGVGKTTTARIIAKGLNCLGTDGQGNPTPNPCGICAACNAIQLERHLDVIEMDAASHTSVDDIREVIETAKYKAVQGRFKVYIIDEVHMLSKSAFNALLKTLEEPPPSVVFIFATTEIQKVPDTILSRCMRFDLKRMDPKTIQEYLLKIASIEALELEGDAAAILSRAADGSMRDALSLLDQALALSKDKKIDSAHVRDMLGFSSKESVYELFNAILNNDAKAIFDKTDFLYQSGVDPSFLMKDLMDVLYWIICLKTLPQLKNDKSHPEFDREQGSAISDKIAINALMQLWQFFGHQQELVGKSHQPLHAFQVICLEAMYLSALPSLEELIKTANNNTPEGLPTLGEKKKLT